MNGTVAPSSSNRTAAAKNRDTVASEMSSDQLTEAQKNVQNQQANQSAFNTLLGVNPQSGAGSAAASGAAFQSAYAGMEQRAAALRAQIDPLGTAQGELNSKLADYDKMLTSGTLGQAEGGERTGHRGPLAGDDAVPDQYFRAIRKPRGDRVGIFAERVHLCGLRLPFGNAELDRLPCRL